MSVYADVERAENRFNAKREVARQRQIYHPVVAIRLGDGPTVLCQAAGKIDGDLFRLAQRAAKGGKGFKAHVTGDREFGDLRLDQMFDPIGDGEVGADHRRTIRRNSRVRNMGLRVTGLFHDLSGFDHGVEQDVCPCFGPVLADLFGFIVA